MLFIIKKNKNYKHKRRLQKWNIYIYICFNYVSKGMLKSVISHIDFWTGCVYDVLKIINVCVYVYDTWMCVYMPPKIIWMIPFPCNIRKCFIISIWCKICLFCSGNCYLKFFKSLKEHQVFVSIDLWVYCTKRKKK